MKLSKSLVAVVVGTALAAGNVNCVAAAAQNETGWGFVDISDDSTEGRGIDAGKPGKSITFVNSTEFELHCYTFGGPAQLVKPAFDVWLQEGTTREQAEEVKDRLESQLRRATAHQVGGRTNGGERYIAPGEEVEIDLSFGMQPGWGMLLTCRPTRGAIGIVLVGYGEVQDDYSLKSSVPDVDQKIPSPPTTPAKTVTVTSTVTKTVVPEASTVTATRTVTATPAKETVTATQTVTALPAAPETATVTSTVTETAQPQASVATVTKTMPAPDEGKGSSAGSTIGWIIGLLLALGLGGAAGLAAQNLPNLPF